MFCIHGGILLLGQNLSPFHLNSSLIEALGTSLGWALARRTHGLGLASALPSLQQACQTLSSINSISGLYVCSTLVLLKWNEPCIWFGQYHKHISCQLHFPKSKHF
jgi:hypothetical protein